MTQHLKLEPMNGNYRIVTNKPGRPVVFEADLPLEIMEDILYAFDTRYREVYDEGFRDGFSQGYEDGLKTTYLGTTSQK